MLMKHQIARIRTLARTRVERDTLQKSNKKYEADGSDISDAEISMCHAALTFYLLLKRDDKMNDQPIPPSPLNVKLSPTPYRLKHSLG